MHQHHHDQHEHSHHDDHRHTAFGHHHGSSVSSNKIFAFSVILNAGFVVVELIYGFLTNSTALLADAGHNLSDVLSLLLAWIAAVLSNRTPKGRFTYGLRSTSILAALTNAMLLLMMCGAIAWEAIQRVAEPPVVAGLTITAVAAVGIAINGLSAFLLMKTNQQDLNMKGAYLHMVADAVVSLGVVISGLAIFYTHWYLIDPIMSLVIVLVIVIGTWGLLRESVTLALNAVPAHIDISSIEAYLRNCMGIVDIHDLHIWGMSTTETALTVHLVMPCGYPGDEFLDEISNTLKSRFAITHSTLQVELGLSEHRCTLHQQTPHG